MVIGNGMTSHRLCRLMDERGGMDRYQMTVFGEEPCPAYDRVNLTQLLAGRSADDLALSPADWYLDRGIDLRLGEAVVEIDRIAKIVRTSAGEVLPYDNLVFATGSTPFVPPIPGRDLPGVFVYRTISDLQAIARYARSCRSAAVIGGGLLGLEAARALHALNLESHVIEVAPHLMPRQLDADAAAVLERRVRQLGIHLHCRSRTERIELNGTSRVIHIVGGATLAVDLVIISAGIRARDELARACGIACEQGILVDAAMRTSDPDIFAIGECARHDGAIYGLVGPGYQMADVACKRLLGGNDELRRPDISTRLKLVGVPVAILGEHHTLENRTITRDDGKVRRQLFIRGRRIVGAVAVGEWHELGSLEQAVAQHRRLTWFQHMRFRRTGNIWGGREQQSVRDWPDTARVCNCVGATRGQLTGAIAGGCMTLAALCDRTGAGSVCGSCRPLLGELLGAVPQPAQRRGSRRLAAASIAVLVAVLAALWLGPVESAVSVQSGLARLEVLWRDPFWKQASGFTLLGLCAATLLLSMRKRIQRFRFGDYRLWRFIHAVIGLFALGVAAAHTGVRLGSNLNLALVVVFLAVGVTGAATGLGTALEDCGSGRWALVGRRWRPRCAAVHLLLLSPLPVLIFFHVLSAYYF